MNGKELFRGLSYISRRYIDEAEFGVLSSAKESAPAARARLRRPLLIAALIALLLLLVGCGAAYIITRNLNWSKELEKDLRFYNEDTSVGAVSKGWVLDEAMFTLSAAPPENGNVTITCGEWSLDATGTPERSGLSQPAGHRSGRPRHHHRRGRRRSPGHRPGQSLAVLLRPGPGADQIWRAGSKDRRLQEPHRPDVHDHRFCLPAGGGGDPRGQDQHSKRLLRPGGQDLEGGILPFAA